MKTSRACTLVLTALIIGFLAVRWCAAQSARQSASKDSTADNLIALHQLDSFVAYLQETKQTNTMQRFGDYSNASIISKSSADLGVNLAILQRLRDGRTNEAYELLEGQVSSDITSFAACYRKLPPALREKVSLKVLGYARDYRAKYPFKHRYQNIDDGVVEAFKILDEKPGK